MSPIEILAAFLLILGSSLVLHALIAGDRGASGAQEHRTTEASYRKAA